MRRDLGFGEVMEPEAPPGLTLDVFYGKLIKGDSGRETVTVDDVVGTSRRPEEAGFSTGLLVQGHSGTENDPRSSI
jgi:hypothetical protein